MSLLDKTRKLNQIATQMSDAETGFAFQRLTEFLGVTLNLYVYITDNEGNLFGYYLLENIDNAKMQRLLAENKFPKAYMRKLVLVNDKLVDLPVSNELTIFPKENQIRYATAYTTILPMYYQQNKIGYIVLANPYAALQSEDLLLAEYTTTLCAVALGEKMKQQQLQYKQRLQSVNESLSALSFNELTAIGAIFELLANKKEERIVISVLANQIGITRSTIVNALKKLNAAGLVTTKSLGPKGTHVKLLQPEVAVDFIRENQIRQPLN